METWFLTTIMGPWSSSIFPMNQLKHNELAEGKANKSVCSAVYICIASLYVFVLKVDGWPSRKKSKVRMLLKRLKMDPQNRQRRICIPHGSNM
jgi:hypothetical protein